MLMPLWPFSSIILFPCYPVISLPHSFFWHSLSWAFQNKMYLPHCDSLRPSLGKSHLFLENELWQSKNPRLQFYKVTRLHLSKGTGISLILVTSGAQRWGGKVMTWIWSDSRQRRGGEMTCRQRDMLVRAAPEADLSPALEWAVKRSQGAWRCNWYWSLNDPLLTLELPESLMSVGVCPWTMYLQDLQVLRGKYVHEIEQWGCCV